MQVYSSVGAVEAKGSWWTVVSCGSPLLLPKGYDPQQLHSKRPSWNSKRGKVFGSRQFAPQSCSTWPICSTVSVGASVGWDPQMDMLVVDPGDLSPAALVSLIQLIHPLPNQWLNGSARIGWTQNLFRLQRIELESQEKVASPSFTSTTCTHQ